MKRDAQAQTHKDAQAMRLFRPGDQCPDCRELLHVSDIANFVDGAVLVWCKCSCATWEVYAVLYVKRMSGSTRQTA